MPQSLTVIVKGGVNMPERLLSRLETAQRLNMSTRSLSRHKARLMALGLQAVQIGQYPKFRELSLDKLIQKLAEDGGGR